MSNVKLEVGNSPQVANLGQGGSMTDFNESACLGAQQHIEQFSYPQPLDNVEQKHNQVMNGRPSPVDYQVNNNFDMPRPIYENGHRFWNPTSATCSIAMFNENGYHQVSNTFVL